MTADLELKFPNVYALARKKEAIDDFRLLGGALFERHGDHSQRRLITWYQQQPELVLVSATGFNFVTEYRLLVSQEAVAKLHESNALEGAPDGTHSNRTRWKLSPQGKKLVVTVWYQREIDVTDILMSGATIDVSTGQVTWSS